MSKEMRLLACFLLFLLSSGQIWQDKTSRKNTQGNSLFQQKNYSEALQKYIEAQDGSKYLPEISYNIANTLYRQKKYPEAIKELEKSISNQKLSLDQRVYFNRGNSFYQVGQYPQAVESYQKALGIDPSDIEAKHNLELALRKLQDSPQQQQNSTPKDQKQEKQHPEQSQKGEGQQPPKGNQQPELPKQERAEHQNQKTDQKQDQAQQNQGQQDEPQKGEQKSGMDAKEALRILDAINNQEKKEQRRQILKVQRKHLSGRDW
jgi:Ca-activated chloride channel homolog